MNKKKYDRVLIIKESKWLRQTPTTRGSSYLYRPSDGKMCCLGFDCRARGFKAKDLADRGSPCDLVTFDTPVGNLQDLISTGTYTNSRLSRDLISVNDNPKLSDAEKKERIKSLYAAHRILVKFVP